MSTDYSKHALLDFMDYLSRKGLMNPTTARARKAASKALLDIMDDSEVQDLRTIDIDDVVTRFSNLKGNEFTPASLTTYKSRFQSALTDFLSYRRDPLTFKPKSPQRSKKSSNNDRGRSSANNVADTNVATESPPASKPLPREPDEFIFPIPLRPDVTVRVAGIPNDMTNAEAQKIANVIKALAAPSKTEIPE